MTVLHSPKYEEKELFVFHGKLFCGQLIVGFNSPTLSNITYLFYIFISLQLVLILKLNNFLYGNFLYMVLELLFAGLWVR